MELPSFITPALAYTANAKEETALFYLLRSHGRDLWDFVQIAAADVTWTEQHLSFFKAVLGYVTVEHLRGSLSSETGGMIAKIVQSHSALFQELPLNMTLEGFPFNTLLFSLHSRKLQDLIVKEGRDQNVTALHWKGVDPKWIEVVIHFTHQGTDLWKLSEEELKILLSLSERWEIPLLTQETQQVLKRYINFDNALNWFVEAIREGWPLLQEAAIQKANQQEKGYRLFLPAGFAFENFDRGWDAFEQVANILTHLQFVADLPRQSPFIRACTHVPHLIGLSLEGAQMPSFDIWPPHLGELDLAFCAWLDDTTLRHLVSHCPSLIRLRLTGCQRLTYNGFRELGKLRLLRDLDLSLISHLKDEDIRLLAQTNPRLETLKIDKCRLLTPDILREFPRLFRSLKNRF